jgi:hypothetical protein
MNTQLSYTVTKLIQLRYFPYKDLLELAVARELD